MSVEDFEADECERRESCGYHYRVSEHHTDPVNGYGIYVDYHGEYAVSTVLNPNYTPPLLSSILGIANPTSEREAFETRVFKVGDGALCEVFRGEDFSGDNFTAWRQTHDSFENLLAAHEMTLGMLRADILELSI